MGALSNREAGFHLLTDYLNVCNAASEAHRDVFPYKPLIAAYDKLFDRQVSVDIYDRDTDDVETTVTIQLIDGKFEPVPEAEAHPSFHLKLKRQYMEDVVAHPREYIRHPEKLDWDWIKSRVGLKPHHGAPEGANMRPPEMERYPAPAKGANMRPHAERNDS